MYSSFSMIPTVLFIWCFQNPEILSSSPNVWYIDWFELTKTCWTMRFFQTRNVSKCVLYPATWFQNGPYQPGSELTQGDFKADFSSSSWGSTGEHCMLQYLTSAPASFLGIPSWRGVWLRQQTPPPCNGWPPHWTRQPSAMPGRHT